uniref:Pkinase_Tyr domain-containing protein n=1 Tax=Macrostomum lignano TaxID=282301 RepID=A0A1I8F894_9PLAT
QAICVATGVSGSGTRRQRFSLSLADKTSSIPDSAFTTASDVFAFSVIMYEVCAGRLSVRQNATGARYMENVCQGRRDTVQDIRVSDIIKETHHGM